MENNVNSKTNPKDDKMGLGPQLAYRAWNPVVVALLALCLFLGASAFATQVTEGQARELARVSVTSHLGGVNRFLEITDDSAAEKSLANVLPGPSGSLPYIFRVSREGEERTDTNTVVSHVNTEGWGNVLVAVSKTGHVFLIHGAIDSEQQFNDLASELGVRVSNTDEARKYLDFYLTVDPANRFEVTDGPANYRLLKLNSASELKDAAMRRFSSFNAPPTASRDFARWWQKHGQQAEKLAFEPSIVRVDQKFKITFFVLSDIDRKNPKPGPAILHASIEVFPTGRVGRVKLTH
jgi:hypothetical protein